MAWMTEARLTSYWAWFGIALTIIVGSHCKRMFDELLHASLY